jgi:hypothetical protein
VASFTAHVVHYDDRKTDLLLDCLIPAAAELAAESGVATVFLERHWRFGPHVRICVDGGADGLQRWFEQHTRPRIEAYLREHPSREVLDRAAYLRRSARLGAAELVLPPYGPIWPDNRVVVGSYDPRADLHGASGVAVKSRFLAAAVEPVRALLEATRWSRPQRLDYVLRLLTIVATTYENDIGGGSMSFRSHVEDFLHREDRDGGIRAAFDAKFASVRTQLVDVVRDLAGTTSSGSYGGDDPILAAWSALFVDGWRDIERLAFLNEIDEDPSQRYLEVAKRVSDEATTRWDFSGRRRFGDFHVSLRSLDYMVERQNVRMFATYRWLVNLFYMVVPLLDVSPIERYFLTHAVACAADEVCGVTWEQRLAHLGAETKGGRP